MIDLARGAGGTLFTGEEKEEMQRSALLSLLERQIERYTCGISTSVPLETVGSLLRSMQYVFSLAAGGTQSGGSLEVMFQEGRECIARLTKKAKRMYYLVKSTMLPIDAPCYRDAIEKGIPAFFAGYDTEFAAHETPGDFDYPASVISQQTGILWMLHFMETLYWENMFCRRYPLGAVEGTLRAHGLLGEAVPLNIFEPVFAAAVFQYLLPAGREGSLNIRGEDVRLLAAHTAHMPKEAVHGLVTEGCTRMMADGKIQSQSYRALLLSQADSLVRHLAPACARGELCGVFPAWESPPPPVVAADGEPMDGEEFRPLSAEVAACRHYSDKLALVRRRVQSLYDLTGLLSCGCFGEEEMQRLYPLLGEDVLPALLRMGSGCMRARGGFAFARGKEEYQDLPVWEKGLYAYLDTIPEARRGAIFRLAEGIRLTP